MTPFYTLHVVDALGNKYEFCTLDLAPTITLARMLLLGGAQSTKITSSEQFGQLITVTFDH